MSKPVLYLDFDGVVNFSASRSKYTKHSDTPHRLGRASVFVDKSWCDLNWSRELVYKLNSLKDDTGFNLLWLSTWLGHTASVEATLGLKSDGFLDWDAESNLPLKLDELILERDNRKYDVLKINVANRGMPFVWVDDSATKLFNPKDFNPLPPHLVLTPDEDYGLTRSDLSAIDTFMRKYA